MAGFNAPITTKLEPLSRFYPAEAYHQNYLTRHPSAAYIVYNDSPKIENLRKLFPDLYRGTPAQVRGAFAGALKKKLGLTIVSEKVDGRGRVYRTET